MGNVFLLQIVTSLRSSGSNFKVKHEIKPVEHRLNRVGIKTHILNNPFNELMKFSKFEAAYHYVLI